MYSIIITDYRTIDITVEYIRSFIQKCDDNLHFIIVDNSNCHDGIHYLKEGKKQYETTIFQGKYCYGFIINEKKIIIIDAAENGGYAKGNNLGAEYALQLYRDPYYIFCNNDLELPEHMQLKKMSKWMEQVSTIGIIGPDVVTQDGSRQNPRKNRGILSQMILWDICTLVLNGKFSSKLCNLDNNIECGETDWISGSFMFIRAKAFHEVGGYDENTFLYAEEMIISTQMRNRGYTTYYIPDIKIIHHHKGTQSRISRKILHKSKRYYYEKYTDTPKALLLLSDIVYNLAELGLWIKHTLIMENIRKFGWGHGRKQ